MDVFARFWHLKLEIELTHLGLKKRVAWIKLNLEILLWDTWNIQRHVAFYPVRYVWKGIRFGVLADADFVSVCFSGLRLSLSLVAEFHRPHVCRVVIWPSHCPDSAFVRQFPLAFQTAVPLTAHFGFSLILLGGQTLKQPLQTVSARGILNSTRSAFSVAIASAEGNERPI